MQLQSLSVLFPATEMCHKNFAVTSFTIVHNSSSLTPFILNYFNHLSSKYSFCLKTWCNLLSSTFNFVFLFISGLSLQFWSTIDKEAGCDLSLNCIWPPSHLSICRQTLNGYINSHCNVLVKKKLSKTCFYSWCPPNGALKLNIDKVASVKKFQMIITLKLHTQGCKTCLFSTFINDYIIFALKWLKIDLEIVQGWRTCARRGSPSTRLNRRRWLAKHTFYQPKPTLVVFYSHY